MVQTQTGVEQAFSDASNAAYVANGTYNDMECIMDESCVGYIGSMFNYFSEITVEGGLLVSGVSYNVSVTAENMMGKAVSSMIVQRQTDPVPKMMVVGAKKRKVEVSKGARVEIFIDPKTTCDQVSFEWSFLTSKTFKGFNANKKDLRIPQRAPGLMGGETYEMRLVATTLGGATASVDVTLDTVASDLVAIMGGPSGEFPNDKTLVLTGGSSFDPDDPTDTSGAKTFKWTCSRSDKLPCFTGTQQALNNGTHYTIAPTDTERLLKGGVEYTFTLKVSKGMRSKTVVKVVPVLEASVDTPIGNVFQQCITAVCPTSHNPDSRLVLLATQTTAFTDVTYKWSVTTGNTTTILPNTGMVAIINPTTLIQGTTQTFSVTFERVIAGVVAKSTATERVKMNGKPKCQNANGCVTITPSTGFALGETEFTLSGKGFTDDEELEYYFGMYLNGKRVNSYGKRNIATKVIKTLKAGTQTLFICARDTYGSELCQDTVVTVQKKEVVVDTAKVAELDTELANIQKSGDTQALIEVASKAAEVYSAGSSTAVDAPAVNLTQIAEKKKELANIAKSALTVSSTTDVAAAKEQRGAVTELLRSVTSDTSTASADTATLAMESLEASVSMGDMDETLAQSTVDVLSQTIALMSSISLVETAPAPTPAPAPTTPTTPSPTTPSPTTPAPAPAPTTPAPAAPAPALQTVTAEEAQVAAKMKEKTENTISLVTDSMVDDFVAGQDPPKVLSTPQFDIIGSKDDVNSLAGLEFKGAERAVETTTTTSRRRLQNDTATASTSQFKVEFADDFGTECESSTKCPLPLTNKVNYMVDASLLLKSVGGLESISLEPGATNVEVISGVAKVTQNRVGVVTNSNVNITFPTTTDSTKKRSCLFVDPITGDLVGYTSEVKQGWTTCPRGYPEPCTAIVEDKAEEVTCQSKSTGEFLIVQYSPPAYPPPPPPSPPPPVFNFAPEAAAPNPPPPPPPSVVAILSGGSGGDDTLIAIGGAVGGFVFLCCIVALVMYFKKINAQKQQIKNTKQVDIGQEPVQAYGGAPPTAYPPVN
jgi:hypothetical protein